MNPAETLPSAAVIGGGVSGITAAYLLQQKFDVTLFEGNGYLGGHTNTFIIRGGPDEGTPVDTGFIVLNDRTYPNLHRLLAAWGVEVRYSDMSFGFHCGESGLQYAGTGFNGLFAQRRNILRPAHWRLLSEIARFCKRAASDLRTGKNLDMTLGEYLSTANFHSDLARDYVIPMGAAIWSAPDGAMLEFPAAVFLNFFSNHGLLSLRDRPRWQTVAGGSHQYVRAFRKSFRGKVLLNCAVREVARPEDGSGVRVKIDSDSPKTFDIAVIAVHADQVLNLLADAGPEERSIFGAWHYQKNHTVLHTDQSVLPPNRRAWASWNYYRPPAAREPRALAATYDMNRLQGLHTRERYCVTLNSTRRIDPARVLAEFNYEHPVYTRASVGARERLKELNGARKTFYCGSYFGYGFHEDGVNSAISIASKLGVNND